MTRMRYLGAATYRGYDVAAGRLVVVRPGGYVSVSEEKARDLEADFPGLWERAGGGGRRRRRPRRRPDRNKMTRPEEVK